MLTGIGQAQRQYHRQKKLNVQQYGHQRMLNQQGHDLQMDMWNKTNYRAQMEHMKAAGLNPALMYGSAGAPGTTGSQTGGSAQGGAAAKESAMDMSNLMIGKQIEEADSRIGLNKDLGYKAVEEGKAVGGYKREESYGQQDKWKTEIEGINAEIGRKMQETMNLKQQHDLTNEQWEGLIMQEVQKGWQEYEKVGNIKADTSLKKRQQKEIGEKLGLMTTDLMIKNEANRIKNTQVEVDKLKAEITKYIGELQVDQKTKQMWMDNGVRLIGVIASFLKPGGGGLEIINNVVQ